jgi:hypothetical protein
LIRNEQEKATAARQTVPVTITPEAAALVAELGMQKEFEQMLEHTQQTVPGLHAIRVVLADLYDTGDEPHVLLEAWMTVADIVHDPTPEQWGRWQVETFPPQVCEHFGLFPMYEAPNGR